MLNMDLSSGPAERQEEDAGCAKTTQRILACSKVKRAILIGISVIVGGIFFGLGTLVPFHRQRGAIPVTCPPDWIGYQGHCYEFSKEEKTFEESQNFCMWHNASLAKITKEDMDLVMNIIRGNVFWINLIKEPNQPWKWGDGETATLKVWGDGENCAYLNDDGTASSGRCTTKHRFICKKLIL
uniref:C-type lectin domain-containing protein n=1 Tax=Naja naja TaxID=35670 RepID=A0A8C6VC08_NAJNA